MNLEPVESGDLDLSTAVFLLDAAAFFGTAPFAVLANLVRLRVVGHNGGAWPYRR